MPDPRYKANDPKYYTVRGQFGNMGNLIGGQIDETLPDDEKAQAKASVENYRAYVISSLPWEASSENQINAVLKIAPELQIDQTQREKRHQMSEKARQAIIKTALRRAFMMDGRPSIDRLDSCFYYRGNTIGIKARNDQVQQQLLGTAEDRGRMLQDRVNNIYELYQRVLNHEVQDDELIERLEDFHILQDLVMNAQNFIKGTQPDDVSAKIYISFPPELGKILKDMERNSSEIFRFVERVRIMANPNYEFLDLEQMLDLENEKFNDLFEHAVMKTDDAVMADAAQFVHTARAAKRTAGRDNMMKRIVDDFPGEYENARLHFVGTDSKLHGTTYNTEHQDTTIEDHLHRGGVLVAVPSGKAICYHLDNATGRIKVSDSSELFAQVTASAAGMLKALKVANKGFFIGSKEYRKALADMPEVLNRIREVSNPPKLEQMEQASVKLRETLENAEKYLNNKNRGHDSYSAVISRMSTRERNRYEAMRSLAEYCKAQLDVYALKCQEMQAQRDVFLGDEEEAEKSIWDDFSEVFPKVDAVYGKEIPPASGVGDIADQLRADIKQKLEKILTEDGFNPDKARDTLSKMVLLEIIKMGRGVNTVDGELGVTRVSELEKSLAQKSEATVRSVRNHSYFQAATERLDKDMLRQFVMTDRARAVAEKLIQMAAEKAHGNKDSELQMQNEQEKNKQQDALAK